jgi:hypothetical protein
LGLGLAVRGAYRVLVERPEEKRPLGINMHRREDNIKMDFQKSEMGDIYWVDLAQDTDRWQEFHCAS